MVVDLTDREKEELEALAQTVYPAAEFPGAKHGTELAGYFSAADLFVLPGTGGLAVQEAMSYGLPVIMGQGDGTNDQLVRPDGTRVPLRVKSVVGLIPVLAALDVSPDGFALHRRRTVGPPAVAVEDFADLAEHVAAGQDAKHRNTVSLDGKTLTFHIAPGDGDNGYIEKAMRRLFPEYNKVWESEH